VRPSTSTAGFGDIIGGLGIGELEPELEELELALPPGLKGCGAVAAGGGAVTGFNPCGSYRVAGFPSAYS
jgi:hypothetical protein